MSESRLTPCNLSSWPGVADKLPDQKLIWYYLWTNKHTNSIGCYLFPVGAAAGELSLGESALREALGYFKGVQLIDLDEKTGEILVLRWWAFHKLSTPRQQRMALDAIKKIQSDRLRELVANQINELLPKGTERNVSQRNANKGEGQDKAPGPSPHELTAVAIVNDDDRRQLDALIKLHGVDAVRAVAEQARAAGERAYVSEVRRRLPRRPHAHVNQGRASAQERTDKPAGTNYANFEDL